MFPLGFVTQTSYASATAWSVSTSSGNGSPNFARKLRCESPSSGEMP